MILILHGDDTVRTRNELQMVRSNASGKEIRQIDGKYVKDDELIQALSSSSLFGNDTLVIIENLFSGLGKKLKRVQELGALLVAHSNEVDVILWESKEVGKTTMTALGPKVQQKLYKIPTIIFQFLDSFMPGNGPSEVVLYRKLLEHEPAELVHSMLAKRVKVLMSIKAGTLADPIAPWQLTRLTNQVRPFTLERLTALYKELRLFEQSRNNGTSVFDIRESTELLLARL